MYRTGISNDTTASKGNTFSASDDSPADRARERPEHGKGNFWEGSQEKEAPLKPEGEAGRVSGVARVAARIHELEEGVRTQLKLLN